ncbi:MAG: superoxide dismutase [Nitrospirae bacterium]|nr:superoxide dismutase [Nitrospirota bacterium]
MAHELPALPYGYDALEPHLDAKTVEIHHDKHHQAYTDKLNAALETHPELTEKSVVELLSNLSSVPEDIRKAVQNHGGGYHNHKLFWETMGPDGGGEPEGELKTAIEKAFGDFASFKEKFTNAAATLFGSGWTWLSTDKAGEVKIHTTQNQDSPLSEGLIPLLPLDIWEHAYYLKFQNRRPEFIQSWWNVVNWKEVEKKFTAR